MTRLKKTTEPVHKKKRWSAPKLVVLVRSEAEEMVLTGCKGSVSGSPNNVNANCERYTIDCFPCSPIGFS